MGTVTRVGFIDEHGVYHKGKEKALPPERSSQFKDWDHAMQRKEYHKEIIQPRKNGRPNPAFIRAYPNYSKKYFSQEEIDKSLREQI